MSIHSRTKGTYLQKTCRDPTFIVSSCTSLAAVSEAETARRLFCSCVWRSVFCETSVRTSDLLSNSSCCACVVPRWSLLRSSSCAALSATTFASYNSYTLFISNAVHKNHVLFFITFLSCYQCFTRNLDAKRFQGDLCRSPKIPRNHTKCLICIAYVLFQGQFQLFLFNF